MDRCKVHVGNKENWMMIMMVMVLLLAARSAIE